MLLSFGDFFFHFLFGKQHTRSTGNKLFTGPKSVSNAEWNILILLHCQQHGANKNMTKDKGKHCFYFPGILLRISISDACCHNLLLRQFALSGKSFQSSSPDWSIRSDRKESVFLDQWWLRSVRFVTVVRDVSSLQKFSLFLQEWQRKLGKKEYNPVHLEFCFQRYLFADKKWLKAWEHKRTGDGNLWLRLWE